MCGVNLELMDEDAAEFAAFFLSDGWVFGDLPDLLVQYLLFLLTEMSDSLLKGAGLDDSHDVSSKLVFGGLALIHLLDADKDVLYYAVGQLRIVFRALANPCPVLDLSSYGTVINGTA